MDLATVMPAIVSVGTSLLMIIFGGGLVLGAAYYVFVIRKRRTWLVDIWERKADGRIYVVSKDTLIRKVYNKGRQVAYILKYAKADVVPPPVECCHRYGKREYAHYLRQFNDYIPLNVNITPPTEQEAEVTDNNGVTKRVKTSQLLLKKLWMRFKLLAGMKPKEQKLEESLLDKKYMYAPLNPAIVGTLKFEPMDYDLSVQMTNSFETLEKIYADQRNWWEKYGAYVMIGICVAGMIVVMYMSYGYGSEVVKQSLGAADKVSAPLNNIVNALGAVSSNKPPI